MLNEIVSMYCGLAGISSLPVFFMHSLIINIKISSVFLARIDVLRYTIINCKPDNRQQNIEESYVLLPLTTDVNCAKIINNLHHAHF